MLTETEGHLDKPSRAAGEQGARSAAGFSRCPEALEITLIRRAYIALLKASYGLTATSTLLMVLTALPGSYWLAPQIGLWAASLFIGMRLSLDIRLFELFISVPEADREALIPKVLMTLVGQCAPSRRLQEQVHPFSREKGARTWLVRQGAIVALQWLLFLSSSIAWIWQRSG